MPPETLQWPASEIEAKLHLSDSQREELDALSRMSAFAKNTLNFDCQPEENLTAPDRLRRPNKARRHAGRDQEVAPALDDFWRR